MKTLSTLMLVCMAWAQCLAQTPDIIFDAAQVSHVFGGFGAQVWAGDTRIQPMLTSLNLKYVRMKMGGNWSPPVDSTQAAMDTYVASKLDSDSAIRTTFSMLNSLGIKVIANQFEGPSSWLGTSNRLKSANFDDMARLWASMAYYMQNHNMPISYIEMFNEPEGDWNVLVPGADYNTMAKLLRQELDSRGLTSVQICGPGLAYLYNAPGWISALDAQGTAALGAWSTHAWDEGWGHTAELPAFLDSRYKVYFDAYVLQKDPSRSKPVIITEYATGVLTYNGLTFSGDAVYDSNQFAQRSFENTLTLINDGANVLSYWQASDHDWMSSGTSGLMRKQSLGSTYRPVYYAMLTLMPNIPVNSMVLTKTWNDSQVSAAAFVSGDTFAAAFANSTAQTVTKTVQFNNVSTLTLTKAEAFVNGVIIDKLPTLAIDYETKQLVITMAPESTLTITASMNCQAGLEGDVSGDCKVNLKDLAMLAGNWQKDTRTSESQEIENFEGYTNSADFIAFWVPTANLQLSLDTAVKHSGSKSMKFSYNNGLSPWFSKAEHWISGNGVGLDWSGYDTLSIWFKCTVAKEPMQVNVVNKYGSNVLAAVYGTPQVGDWKQWKIDLRSIPAVELTQIGRVDIFFTANYYGAGTAYFDDITILKDSLLSCQGQLAGDTDNNCIVNFKDISDLTQNWLVCQLFDSSQCW
jgi:hypothetical protein